MAGTATGGNAKTMEGFGGVKMESKLNVNYESGLVNQLWNMESIDFDEYC